MGYGLVDDGSLRFGKTASLTHGRLSGQENLSSPACQAFNDLPRLWFFGVSQKVS
jgi:hypothetical protein